MFIDKDIIEGLLDSIEYKGSCADGTCDHCKIQNDLPKIRSLDCILDNLLHTTLNKGIMKGIQDSFVTGFCLAYDYQEVRMLEKDFQE